MMGTLRERLAGIAGELDAELRAGHDGTALCRARTAKLDALFAEHFADACGVKPAVALAAVGSYGRGVPALHSDVDLRFLPVKGARDKDVSEHVNAVMYPLWDAGVTVGHQVIDADVVSLAREDLTTATSLLDLRHLVGPAAPLRDLRAVARAELFGPSKARDLARRLEEEAEARHERYGGSVYLLEPDVRSGEGGLRDLDVLGWCSGMTSSGGPAAGAHWLDARELESLQQAEEFLRRVRNRLHALVGRRSDRLTFDAQESVAVAMGYAGAVAPDEGDAGDDARAAAAERMMQDYYLHARTLSRLRLRAFERAQSKKRAPGHGKTLAPGVVLMGKEVCLEDEAALSAEPALALRAYLVAARTGSPVSSDTRVAITRAAVEPAFGEGLRASAEARDAFQELVSTCKETPLAKGSPVRELADTGILHAMVPEFLPVTGRVHHDVYHVYTVDVHSVAAVDCLRALVRGDLRAEHPLASRLAAETGRRAPLFLATLLHDMGKGYPDASGSRKHHSERGAELCDVVLPRLGLADDEIADARALVLNHLVMYHLATRRDLDDPATTLELARVVRGREGLRDLYLLTLVDIKTTAPTAMTSWKAHVLEDLYLRTDAQMSGMPDAQQERMERVVRAATRAWEGDRAELLAFVESMPMRWRVATAPDAIAVHARTAIAAGAGIRVAVVESGAPDHVDLCVVAPDRDGLLARIAAALTANRLEVLAAQVYSRALPGGAQAVDVFSVRHPQGKAAVLGALPRLEKDLAELCLGTRAPRDLIVSRAGATLPWRSRPTPAVPVEIVFDEHASAHATVVEVFAKDEPGLLFRLAQALADLGLSIVLSKINTEGTKVADVFYVHESDGRKVEGAARLEEIRSRLREAVE